MPPLILDSVTHLKDDARGHVAACASHGAVYAAWYAASKGVAALVLNDAGVGRQQAGISGLPYLDGLGVPGATVSHNSARIGWGEDMPARGVLSFVNRTAAALGLAPGMACDEALAILGRANLPPAPTPSPLDEARHEIVEASANGIRVFVLDSNGLVGKDDTGHVVVTASHGGLLAGKPETAVKADVLVAVYVDADRGLDDAGISRLPALQARGIAGGAVSAFSARIGDGLSVWTDGFISALNPLAGQRGGVIGQSTRDFVAAMVASKATG
ncbi:MAG: hypothetical protein JNK84_17990 [Phreatobacter sp.]|uniref:hypothetical protein n=1 Tax=Phreatobacter sp. TaxID=1966341 RepID=UPI001A4DF8B9|nr:hypothetical protein [Phreatobacter sp.]MBL8570965.1 hypothetical protein [Phreatobacter sp.]